MDSVAGGWLWFVIDVLMVAVLAVALIYATVLWRRRKGRLEQVSERATAQLYEREAERERKAEADRERVGSSCSPHCLSFSCAVWYARALECPWPAAAPPEIAMLVCAGGPA
jgi:nitrogen fixation-related uncharacterized protein